ncbi:MAG: type II toxin-antitoxin system HicA family toxin [Bacteroidetes bacterium]|nr:MAG: type II toxin-antitoxin system HicA family toxin [Bacteroidota bacterium]
MAKIEKLIARFLLRPADLTWDELIHVLSYFGYHELKKGKTGGSRRKFADEAKRMINLHKPHPGNIVKRYMIDQVIAVLKENGNIKNE